ncbi:allantoinase AllB [Agromyces tropicus]|uniref:allantoinase n=1 Tax=Agromyces tropicus TaxID=555371 RepID=A0ABP5FHT4_9MICO
MTSPASIAARRAFVQGAWRAATVEIDGGLVTAVSGFRDTADVVLPGHEVLLPGLVDSHVHLNDPGREWEGFASGTASAAAGGVTTLLDMPLNSAPVTTTLAALALKRAAAAASGLAVDVGYWGGAIPGNLGFLRDLAESGVAGFKCFLAPSGIDEFRELDAGELMDAMTEAAALDRPILVHAEHPAHLLEHEGPIGPDHRRFEATRPPASEQKAVRLVIDAARTTGARAHIVHLSDAGVLPLIREAKANGVRMTVETCPHYLTLVSSDVPSGATEYKCCPPIRDAGNRDALWAGLVDGTIDAVVSDHSPASVALKRPDSGDFGAAWGGISGLQTGIVTVWTEARRRGINLEHVVPWFTTGVARVAGLERVGTIEAGTPAHLVRFDPDVEWSIDAERLLYRQPLSPWHGARVRGAVMATYVRGHLTYTRDAGVRDPRLGREVLIGADGARRG